MKRHTMHLFFLGLCVVTLSLPPLLAHGQIYSCKDASGRTVTSDRPMSECGDRAIRELSKTGVIKREIPAEMTPEQKRQREAIEEKQRTEAALTEQKKQQDRALLARYHSENDIEISRRSALAQTQDLIKLDQKTINETESKLKTIETETQFYKTKTIPFELQTRIDDTTQFLINKKKQMADHQNDLSLINARFDEMLKRYREVTHTIETDESVPKQSK